jgi:hypothetical protein
MRPPDSAGSFGNIHSNTPRFIEGQHASDVRLVGGSHA